MHGNQPNTLKKRVSVQKVTVYSFLMNKELLKNCEEPLINGKNNKASF